MDIRTSGFDISAQIVANIEAGKMVSSLDQQPYYQGFMTVTMLYHWAKYGLSPATSTLATTSSTRARLRC